MLEQHLLAFGRRYQQIAQPFEWKFTRKDLNRFSTSSKPHTHPTRSPPKPIRARTYEPDH